MALQPTGTRSHLADLPHDQLAKLIYTKNSAARLAARQSCCQQSSSSVVSPARGPVAHRSASFHIVPLKLFSPGRCRSEIIARFHEVQAPKHRSTEAPK